MIMQPKRMRIDAFDATRSTARTGFSDPSRIDSSRDELSCCSSQDDAGHSRLPDWRDRPYLPRRGVRRVGPGSYGAGTSRSWHRAEHSQHGEDTTVVVR